MIKQWNIRGGSQSVQIYYDGLDLKNQNSIFKTIKKFKKSIIATIVISGLIFIVFKKRKSLKNFIKRILIIYNRFYNKIHKFSKKKNF